MLLSSQSNPIYINIYFFSIIYHFYAGACGMDRRQNTYIMEKSFKGMVSSACSHPGKEFEKGVVEEVR